jgi:predicted RNA-binding protein with PUA-like domain
MTNYWLIKSEPNSYSIEDLARDKRTQWSGVRNFQARNLLRDEWKVGDELLFYHSNADETGVAGVARVGKVGLPDPTQFKKGTDYYDPRATQADPRWFAPEVVFVKRFPRVVQLAELRADKRLADMMVLKRGVRLSVQPVSAAHFKLISQMAES